MAGMKKTIKIDRFTFRDVSPRLWPDLVRLFGERGACGGCWCQWWRIPRGGKLWETTKGARARKMMKALFNQNEITGLLAYDGDRPVGWCSYGPRSVFPHVEGMKAYHRDDNIDRDRLWCINCFYIDKDYRRIGLARMMLKAALEFIKARGIKTVEAYPKPLTKDGKRLPPAFAYTGPLNIFEEAGFTIIRRLSHSRPLVEIELSHI